MAGSGPQLPPGTLASQGSEHSQSQPNRRAQRKPGSASALRGGCVWEQGVPTDFTLARLSLGILSWQGRTRARLRPLL